MCTVHGDIYTQSVYTHKRNSILYPLCCCCCSVTQLCPSVCDIMNCSTPGFPELHHLPEFAQTHVHWVYYAIQPSHPLSSPSPHALNLSQNQSLLQWIDSSHHVAEILELQLQHQFSSVAQSHLTLRPLWTAARQASLSFTISRSLFKLMSIESMMPSNHVILCCPILLLPSIFPSIRVFSRESALCIRWPKYWSFSLSISPSNEYSGLISLGWTGLISLLSKGLSSLFLSLQLCQSGMHSIETSRNLVWLFSWASDMQCRPLSWCWAVAATTAPRQPWDPLTDRLTTFPDPDSPSAFHCQYNVWSIAWDSQHFVMRQI